MDCLSSENHTLNCGFIHQETLFDRKKKKTTVFSCRNDIPLLFTPFFVIDKCHRFKKLSKI